MAKYQSREGLFKASQDVNEVKWNNWIYSLTVPVSSLDVQLYHISFNKNLPKQITAQPVYADGGETHEIYNEPLPPRISTSSNIMGCWRGIYANFSDVIEKDPRLRDIDIHVYLVHPDAGATILTPDVAQREWLLYDAHMTDEYSIFGSAVFEYLGEVCLKNTTTSPDEDWDTFHPFNMKKYGTLFSNPPFVVKTTNINKNVTMESVMSFDDEIDEVTLNESSPGVAEMTINKVNVDVHKQPAEHDFREDEDKDKDDDIDEDEEALEKIMGARQKLETINRISSEMADTGLVSKEQRIALESFDTDGVLPHRNGYTAAPSRVNFDETQDFVAQARYKVAGNTYKTMCTNMADNIHHIASTISELPTLTDMKTLLNDHQESVRAMINIRLPDSMAGDVLDNSVLDDGLRAYTRDAHPDDDGEELLECKEEFHAPMIVMGNSIRIQRFVQRAHAIRMSDLTCSISSTLCDDFDEQALAMREILARAWELSEYDVRDNPNQTPLIISKILSSVIHPPEPPFESAVINNCIICDTMIYLLYNPNNDSGECGLPYDIKDALDKFVNSMNNAPEWPDNPETLVTKTEALRESVHVFEKGIDVYIMLIEKTVKLMKRSTHFYTEMYKILDAAIQAATVAPTVQVNVE